MNDEQKKDMTPEQDPVENTVSEEKTAEQAAEDTEKESVTEAGTDAEAAKGEEGKDSEKKEKRRFGRKPSKEEEKIAALEKEKAELNDKFLRICAEYDNFRKRSQKEKDALYGDIKANTVTQFLPVYDNLERALKQPPDVWKDVLDIAGLMAETSLCDVGKTGPAPLVSIPLLSLFA